MSLPTATSQIPDAAGIEAYADRILAAIDADYVDEYVAPVHLSDRRRLQRDVEGLRDHQARGTWDHASCSCGRDYHRECPDALRYWTDLAEIGEQYGVQP